MRRKNLESLQHTIKAFIRKGESYYIAECLELAVVTQGKTLDETVGNLRKAVSLHLEAKICRTRFGPNPTLIITMEVNHWPMSPKPKPSREGCHLYPLTFWFVVYSQIPKNTSCEGDLE